MTITINTGKIGSGPSVTWTISWDGSGTSFSITGTKNADGALYNTNQTAGWTCYVGFEGGSSSSVFFYSKNIGFSNGGSSQTKSYTVSTTISTRPESGTMYFYATSSSFGSTGVISYSNRKQATFYKVTAQDRVGSSSGTLLGSGWERVPSGTTRTGRQVRSASYTGYTYSSTTSATIYSNTTLYNYFTGNSVQVNYYGNDSAGTITNMPSNGTVNYGSPISSNIPVNTYKVTFNANGGSCSITSLDSTRGFSTWNTSSTGSGTDYAAGATMNSTSTLSLYAQWGNASSVTLPTATRTAYRFMGWNTSSTATTGITGSYTPSGNVVLYAIWQANGVIRLYNSSGSFHSYAVWIYLGDNGGPNQDGWHHAMPQVYCNINGSTKYHTAG